MPSYIGGVLLLENRSEIAVGNEGLYGNTVGIINNSYESVISSLNRNFWLNFYLDSVLHDVLYRSIYYAASDVELLRPMVDVTWAPMLVAFSVPLDKSEDEVVTFQCLEGFRHAVHITAVLCMRTQRDAFLTSLAKFTSLHSAADIKQKNIDAIKVFVLFIILPIFLNIDVVINVE